MHHAHSASSRARFLAFPAIVLLLLVPRAALAQTPVALTLDPSTSTIQYRVTLADHEGTWEVGPMNAAAELGAPSQSGGSLVLRNIHFSVGALNCPVSVSVGAPITVALSNIVVTAAPGTGVTLPAQLGADGHIYTFSSDDIVPTSASGSANYNATNQACNTIHNAGGVCSGPFTLAATGSSTQGMIVSGSISPTAQPVAAAFVLYASIPIVSGQTWATLDVRADLRGTLAGAPACAADFNHQGGVSVQDIFDYLSAWFTGNAAADFNHSGAISVQDIFDFLSAWFAGC